MKIKTTGHILIATLILCIVLTGCGNSGTASIEEVSNDSETLKSSIVKITNRTEDGTEIYGTGFFTTDGSMITTSNVVDTPGSVYLTYSDGSTAEARVVSNDISSNVAILETDTQQTETINIADGTKQDKTEYVSEESQGTEETSESTVSEEETSGTEEETSGNIGTTYIITGYSGNSDQLESVEADGVIVDSGNGTDVIVLDTTLDTGFDGAVVTDTEGNAAGMVTLASNKLDYAIATPTEELAKTADTLKEEGTVEINEEEQRSNMYTEYVAQVEETVPENLYVDDTIVQGSVTTDNGVVFSVKQQADPLIRLQYDATIVTDDEAAYFGKSDLSVATLTTDVGTYTCNLNRTKISGGTTGEILLKFEGAEGQAQMLKIDNTTMTDKTENVKIIFGDFNNAEMLMPEAAMAYIEELEKNKDVIGDSVTQNETEKPISFADITGDGLPEMFYTYACTSQYQSYRQEYLYKILTYNYDGLSIITSDGDTSSNNLHDEEGLPRYEKGLAGYHRGCIFTLNDTEKIFFMSSFGWMTSSYSYYKDIITEYELDGNHLTEVNSTLLGRTRESAPRTYELISEVIDGDEEDIMYFDQVFSKVSKVMNSGEIPTAYYEPSVDTSQYSIAMTYDEAIAYLEGFLTAEE